jgi:hypothetical protein
VFDGHRILEARKLNKVTFVNCTRLVIFKI